MSARGAATKPETSPEAPRSGQVAISASDTLTPRPANTPVTAANETGTVTSSNVNPKHSSHPPPR